jgi:hypothetical protein
VQKRRHSALETVVSTLIGLSVAFTANATVLPLFGYVPTVGENLQITAIFTVISLIRGYGVRRLFNYLHVKGVL